MFVPFDQARGVHPQASAFTDHAVWDFAATRPEQYPLFLHFPYFDLYRKQVVKQADLVLAMHVRGDAFTAEQKARNFAYYEALTVRDSSLSAATQAVMATEVGHLDLAHDYLAEAVLIDLYDRERNTRDGLHIAALAGGWTAIVAGFGGMRVRGGEIAFSPRLPHQLSRIAFHLWFRGSRLRVVVTPPEAMYRVESGDPLELRHYDERLVVAKGEPVRRMIPPAPDRPQPRQPPGREPLRRALRRTP
jgi:alpha,alpha-trehalose phosphorylase